VNLPPLPAFANILLAQVDGAAGGAPAAAPPGPFGSLGIFPLVLALGVLFYLMVLKPETTRRKGQEQMRTSLKKNDRVVTIGGIYGTIVNAPQDGDEITIKVDETSNTKLRILRTAVQTVLNKEGSSKESA